MCTYHPILQKKVDSIEKELAQVHRELRAASELLAKRGLLPILDHAIHASVIEDHTWTSGQGRTPADRYWISIDVDASLKDHLRYFLLHGFDSFQKSYRVRQGYSGNPDQLVESWLVEWDHLNAGRYSSSAWNRLEVNFCQPAIEGTRLTPTCSIQTVTQETHRSEQQLKVVCSKPK